MTFRCRCLNLIYFFCVQYFISNFTILIVSQVVWNGNFKYSMSCIADHFWILLCLAVRRAAHNAMGRSWLIAIQQVGQPAMYECHPSTISAPNFLIRLDRISSRITPIRHVCNTIPMSYTMVAVGGWSIDSKYPANFNCNSMTGFQIQRMNDEQVEQVTWNVGDT